MRTRAGAPGGRGQRGATPGPGSRRRRLLWAIPAAAVVAGSLGANRDAAAAASRGTTTGWAAVTAVPAAAAVLVAIRAPRVAVLLNGLAVGGYFALGLVDGPIFVSIPLVAFVAARQARPARLLPWLGAGLAAIVLGLVVRAAAHDAPGWMTAWQIVGSVATVSVAVLLGWWTAVAGEVRAEQARRAVAEERLRMTEDLHDGVGHGLAVIAMQAGVALHLLDRRPAGGAAPDPTLDAVRQSLDVIRLTSKDALEALRAELARMVPDPSQPAAGGADPAARRPQRGLGDLGTLVERVRSGGTAVELISRPPSLVASSDPAGGQGSEGMPGPPALEPAVDAAAYALVQESLTNVLRHSGARRAVVGLTLTGEKLLVTVTDDGSGGTGGPGIVERDEAGKAVAGRGIAGMRSRVHRLGGALEAGPVDGGGWQVRAEFPVPAGEADCT